MNGLTETINNEEICNSRSGDKPFVIHVTTIGITSYRALLAQCVYFREKGMDVGFVFSPSPEGELLRHLGFPVKEILINRRIDLLADSMAILKMRSYFRRMRPDIVHTHTSKAGIVGRVAAKLAGVPKIIHTVHGFPFHPGMSRLKYRVYQQIEKSTAAITDILLSQSREDIVTASELGIKSRMGKVIHIGNGIDLNEFDPGKYSTRRRLQIREALMLSESDPVITMIGRVNQEKGYQDLVEALNGVRDVPWQALFIGPDEGYLSSVKHRIKHYGLQDRIKILGQRSDITDLLAITDIYVLPSYREGLPRSLIEAQSMALPCVATDIRGCREVVKRGVTGLLTRPGDSKALGESLHTLLLEPELRLRMGQEGRKHMQQHFDEAEVSRKVMAIYEKVNQLSSYTSKRD